MNAPQCTLRSPVTQPVGASCRYATALRGRFHALCLFELRVPLNKLFRAAAGEAHGYAAVFVVALNANDGSDAEAGMTNSAAEHGIGIAASLSGRVPEGSLCRLAARSCFRLFRAAARATQAFFRGIPILPVRLIPPRLANVRHSS